MTQAMYWGVEQERALDQEKPQADAQPVQVKVDLNLPSNPWSSEALGKGIRALQAKGARCDVELEVGGEVLPAHQVKLAAVSKPFRTFLKNLRVSGDTVEVTEDSMAGILCVSRPTAPAATAGDAAATPALLQAEAPSASAEIATAAPPADAPAAAADAVTPTPAADNKPVASTEQQRLKLQINGISRLEAVKILLSYVYQVGTGIPFEYKPSCIEVDKDVLHLARHFELNHLHEYAARWLIQGLSTINVVERLVVCEEFQLGNLREKMMEQLAAFPDALGIVSSNPDIMKHPKIMQDLLYTVAFARNKQPEKKVEEKAPEKVPEKADKIEKVEKVAKAEKAEKSEKDEKADKSEKLEKVEKTEKPEKVAEKQEKPSVEKPPVAKKARKAGGA